MVRIEQAEAAAKVWEKKAEMTKTRVNAQDIRKGVGRLFLTVAAFGSVLPGCNQGSEAIVNGETIASADFDSALKLDRGQIVLQRLITEQLVIQEAMREGVVLNDDAMKPFRSQAEAHLKDPGARKVLERDMRVRLLLRKMLLKDVSEKHLNGLYDSFKDDLKQYDLYAIVTKSREDAAKVVSGLSSAFAFESLSDTYGAEPQLKRVRGHLGYLTPSSIRELFGEAGVGVVEDLDEKGFTKNPIRLSRGGFLILRVDHIRASYAELRPKIEDLIVQANAPAFLQKLEQKAKVSVLSPNGIPYSPILEESLAKPMKEEQNAPVDLTESVPETRGVGSAVGADLGLKIPSFQKTKANSVTPTPLPASVK